MKADGPRGIMEDCSSAMHRARRAGWTRTKCAGGTDGTGHRLLAITQRKSNHGREC